MPNHITNIIYCDDELMDEVLTMDDNGNEIFDFNTIIPMPDHIYKGDVGQAERIKYGKNTSLDWCTEHWNTKWPAYSHVRYEGSFGFDTAWSHPFPVMKELSEKYPVTEFIVAYADEDSGSNLGVYSIKNGEIDKSAPIEERTWLAYEMASQIKYGQSYDETLQSDLDSSLIMLNDETWELSDTDREAIEEESQSTKDELELYHIQKEVFLRSNPDFDFSNPKAYLNAEID